MINSAVPQKYYDGNMRGGLLQRHAQLEIFNIRMKSLA